LKLKAISGQNFRNYQSFLWEPADWLNVLVGDNAQGKTNLLEAIHVLATGKSWRTRRDLELIGKGESHMWLSAQVANRYTTSKIDFRLTPQKQIAVNGKAVRRQIDLLGKFLVVTFTPENLALVKGSPQIRRRFLDLCLVQMSESYRTNLVQYNKALKQRNSLLKSGMAHPSLLNPWSEQMVNFGVRLMIERYKALEELGRLAAEYQQQLSGQVESLSIVYEPAVPLPKERTARAWGREFRERLEELLPQERLRGLTLTGPQRDDFALVLNGADLKLYGSQGQMRTTSLALHLAALEFLEQQLGERPLLLLDDVLSELDEKRRERLFSLLEESTQTILTTTGADLWVKKEDNCWRIVSGTISRL
jgi:DNA replication and repair protein RecF